jgi:two-component sensor histidine kinase
LVDTQAIYPREIQRNARIALLLMTGERFAAQGNNRLGSNIEHERGRLCSAQHFQVDRCIILTPCCYDYNIRDYTELARSEVGVLLTAADEGDGFRIDFPETTGTEFGMRLVTTYAGEDMGAVTVDRSVPFSRILVRFPAG